MGKPYAEDLDQLPDTYRWALSQQIHRGLLKAIASTADLPMLVLGSGGSFSSAHFVASLHRDYAGKLSVPMTPLATAATKTDLRETSVVLLTAGGKNPDVLGVFRNVVQREPRRLVVFCTSQGSPVAAAAAKHAFVDVVEMPLPTGKDGFLATNSLIATCVLFLRAYAEAFSAQANLPHSWSKLLGPAHSKLASKAIDKLCSPLWDRETLLVLHGPETTAGAVDLESKFCEAALGNVQTADYRHFAHGRHHWLAKRAEKSALIAFVTPSDKDIAMQTLRLIPKRTPLLRFDLPYTSQQADLAALGHVLAVVGSAGRARGFDPGQPKVPIFGRLIYHLKPKEYNPEPANGMSPLRRAAMNRKMPPAVLASDTQSPFWNQALKAFLNQLYVATFQAVVLDYDGTLCDERAREQPICRELALELSRLLDAGMVIGIATGRGQSVRKDLQKSLEGKHWKKVIVGYYNGADIGYLSENDRPDGTDRAGNLLEPVAMALASHAPLAEMAKIEPRPLQITITPKKPGNSNTLWNTLTHLVAEVGIQGVSVLHSSHSFDVLAPEVTKQSVVERVGTLISAGAPILCIGDRGQWPGNDHVLLSRPYSLSVDEVSADLSTCWNLASPGTRGPQAALEYLKALRPARGGMRLRLAGFSRREK